ncbi:glycerophosphodiester phosphodiesterase family protein [Orrella sp. JC864]|uniref:glycerophosphodiester phosphodiesterase family protein n=1 Tax=Orrella sp. JC864 TaxID=3120298 RepID=UPI0030099B52
MKLRSLCLTLAASLALMLAACSSSDDDHEDSPSPQQPSEPGSPAPEPPAPEPATLLDESFDGASLPQGWRQVSGLVQTVSVRDGSLIIDGTYHNTAGTAVALPDTLARHGNYRVDVTFTILSANNDGRWGSIMYRTSPSAANLEPYYQMAVRQNAAAGNGTELAWRENGAWTVPYTAAFGEAIDPAKTYTATLVVHGTRARQYLDGQLLHDAELSETHLAGGLGLQTAGAVLRVDHVTVKEQLEPLPSLGDMYEAPEPQTGAALAPTLVGGYRSDPATAQGAGNLLMNLDAGLNLHSLSGESAGTLAEFLDRPGHAIPVLRIADAATVQALAPLAQARNLIDITLVSDNAQLLALARQTLPRLRTALDFTGADLGGSRADLLSIVQATNRSGSKIAIVPPALLDRDSVAYLQRMLITVWAGAVDHDRSAAHAAAVLTSGVNGIVTEQVQTYAELLARLPEGTLLRKPLVVGHRGVPSLLDENTLEGAIRAYELGADAIESDIYLSADGHVVVMHDATVDRTTDGTGQIESMTLAQIQALSTINNGYKVPTLAQYFAEFKDKPVTQFVEIKTGNPAIIEPLRELIQAHGVQDQVIFISFLQDQLARARQAMPEVSAGFLSAVPAGADPSRIVRQILTHTQAMSSTFNPSYNNLTPAILEAAKHRGTTFWPWTYRDEDVARQHYQAGTHGLTTDYAQWFSGYAAQLRAPAQASAAAGPLSLPVQLLRQDGSSQTVQADRFVLVQASAPHALAADGQLSFSGPGSAVVLAVHTHDMGNGRSYRIVSQPIAVTVQ